MRCRGLIVISLMVYLDEPRTAIASMKMLRVAFAQRMPLRP